MLISSMGRYAVLILLDLAEHRGGFVPVRQIAERQELSQKYLERILRTLAEHGLVEGTHGKVPCRIDRAGLLRLSSKRPSTRRRTRATCSTI